MMEKDMRYLDINESTIRLINAITGIGNWRLIDMHPQEVIVFMNELSDDPLIEKFNDKWSHASYSPERVLVIYTCGEDGQPNYGIAVWVPINRLPVHYKNIRTRGEDKPIQWRQKREGEVW